MPTTELAGNFIEETADIEYKQNIGLAVDALEEIRNYGSQMFHFLHKDANISYSAMVQLFYLRKMLEIIDSISILIKAQTSADALLRSFFECVVYITHIMEKNTDNRALSFFYVNAVENEIRNDKYNPNTDMGKETKAALTKEYKSTLLDEYVEYIEARKQELQTLRERPEFKHISEEYTAVKTLMNKNQKREQRPPWYYLFGGSRSFKDLCDRLGFQGRYKIMFEYLSEVVHAQDIIKGVEVLDNGGIKYPLFRNNQDYRSQVNNVFLLSFQVFKSYLSNHPEEEVTFHKWALTTGIKYKDVLVSPE